MRRLLDWAMGVWAGAAACVLVACLLVGYCAGTLPGDDFLKEET